MRFMKRTVFSHSPSLKFCFLKRPTSEMQAGLQVQYVVGAETVSSGEVAVQIENGAGEELDSSESSEAYDPQTVTVPVTLCLAIIVG